MTDILRKNRYLGEPKGPGAELTKPIIGVGCASVFWGRLYSRVA